MSTETAVVVAPTPKTAVAIGNQGLQFADMDGLIRFSQAVAKSGLAPKGIETAEAIFIAIQMGLELGMTPMAALQNIGVINGRPAIYGDSALGLIRKSGFLEDYSEVYEGTPGADAYTCVVTSKRRDMSKPMVSRFSVADAKKAQLWGKQGPWSQYPERMLKWRARGFNLRDNFGDVLKGFRTTEELADEPEDRRVNNAKTAVVSESTTVEEVVKTVEKTPQQQLADVVVEAGHNFDTFCKWGKELGHITDEPTSFDDLKPDLAKRLLRAKTGLLAGLAQVGGAK